VTFRKLLSAAENGKKANAIQTIQQAQCLFYDCANARQKYLPIILQYSFFLHFILSLEKSPCFCFAKQGLLIFSDDLGENIKTGARKIQSDISKSNKYLFPEIAYNKKCMFGLK
jgi:hypothetical protein